MRISRSSTARTGLQVDLPADRVVSLAYKDAPPLADPAAEFAASAGAADRHAAVGRIGPRARDRPAS